MVTEEKKVINEFISSIEGLVIGMQQVDASCMEAYKDVTKREFNLLVMLGKSETMIMREVADFLQIPVSTTTGIIDKLIDKGYVVREFSPENRRIILIRLSPEGKSIYLTLKSKLHIFGENVLVNFTEEEKREFIRLMNKAARNTTGMTLEKK